MTTTCGLCHLPIVHLGTHQWTDPSNNVAGSFPLMHEHHPEGPWQMATYMLVVVPSPGHPATTGPIVQPYTLAELGEAHRAVWRKDTYGERWATDANTASSVYVPALEAEVERLSAEVARLTAAVSA